jgi:type VII secretion integral membrane protein EccD
MAPFSRVTLVGERRRADVVLPSEEPIGLLLPAVLHLVDDRVESPPRLRQLVTADGDVLRGEATLATAEIPDGAVLTVARANDTPPAPIVHDVTEETSDDLDVRAWRWGPGARRWTATATAAVALAAACPLARDALGPRTAVVLLMLAAIALGAAGGLVARLAHEPLGTALMIGGSCAGVMAAWFAADAHDWPGWARWGTAGLVAAVFLALLGLASALGRGGVIGGAFALGVAALWMAGAAAGLPAGRLAACASVIIVISIGVLPRLALVSSGLATLDDRRSAGSPVSRHDVADALAAAHRGLVIATATVAAVAALTGILLARAAGDWTVPLALLLALVLVSRARVFPIAMQVVALHAAAVVVLLALLNAWMAHSAGPPYGPLAVTVAAASIPLATLTLQPSDHMRVRLRRAVDRVEMLAVVAVIPLTIGVFGTYGRLLHVFG